jgi:hypothetical protein
MRVHCANVWKNSSYLDCTEGTEDTTDAELLRAVFPFVLRADLIS